MSSLMAGRLLPSLECSEDQVQVMRRNSGLLPIMSGTGSCCDGWTNLSDRMKRAAVITASAKHAVSRVSAPTSSTYFLLERLGRDRR